MKISDLTKAAVYSPDMVVPVELYGQNLAIRADMLKGRDGVTPYLTAAYALDGAFIRNGQGTVRLGVRVTKGGVVVEDASSPSKSFSYEWTKYDKNGEIANWADTASSVRSGNPITVSGADIDDKSTFRCRVTKP